MAEFIIKAVDAVHPDPQIDQSGCYKLGDIVEVRPDGANYGRCECLPTFFIVKIPGLSVETARKYMDPEVISIGAGDDIISKRRKYHFDWSIVPAGVKNTLLTTGTYTVAWSVVKNYVRNKITGLTE
jgi:hypothetical protein